MPPKRSSSSSRVFAELTFCVSGSFSRSQDELRRLIVQHGGTCTSTVTAATDYLVCDRAGSGKFNDARRKGKGVVTERWLDESIDQGAASDDRTLFLSHPNDTQTSGGGSRVNKRKLGGKKEEEEEDSSEAQEDEEPEEDGGGDGADSDRYFAGMVFALSGSLAGCSQSEARRVLIEHGGTVASSLTAAVTHVIAAATGSAKVQQAMGRGIPVLRPEWLDRSIEAGRKMPVDDSALRWTGDEDGGTQEEKEDGDDEEEEEEERSPAHKKAKSDQSALTATTATSPTKLKTVVVKGRAPVDECCPVAAQCHVIEDASGVYDAALNQTNIGNNNNKFYLIQALQSDSGSLFYCWTRWGRVGERGQSSLAQCSSAAAAKSQLEKKFADKTRNQWSNRANFQAVAGKYTLIERDYSAETDGEQDEGKGQEAGEGAAEKTREKESELDSRVQELVRLICDVDMMRKQMVEIGYDASRLPLGKLSKEHINKGYQILKQLSDELSAGSTSRSRLVALSNTFFSTIPHSFGRTVPPVIDTMAKVKEKLDLVEALGDIEVAMKLLRDDSSVHDEHPIDRKYRQLACDIRPLDKTHPTVQLVRDYVQRTHGRTHTAFGLEVDEVFEIDRNGEGQRYASHANDGNRMLLWHGSRLSNFTGILGEGLRIAPPSAPVTGYMFGKGVYFADMVSKSANYCAVVRDNPTACMLLCEVALGGVNELYDADFNASQLPAGKLSTKGVGLVAPDSSQFQQLDNGCVVPCGTGIAAKTSRTPTLQYNEYIGHTATNTPAKDS